jgi:putative peptide zinc metalloprotease protein
VWAEVGDETLVVAPPQAGVWSASRAGDFVHLKPTRRLGWALKELQTAGGEAYYVLKNVRAGTYLRLTEEQVFIWDLMDGEHTIQDIAVAYFVRFKSLAIQGLLVFMGQLEAKGFLAGTRVNAYAQTAAALGQRRLSSLGRRLWRAFTQTTFAIRGIDGLLATLYRGGVFLVFTRPVQLAVLLVTLAGLVAFAHHVYTGAYSVLTGGSEQVTLGLVALYAAQFLAVFLHEAAHAFTCKHYGREVRRAGFMIYLGMPAFFVDTTDVWMEPRRPRLLVSWAGPYSGFFLASLASLLALAAPSPFVGGLLFQFAFTCNVLSFTNLNPLLTLDGYYILMDWLETPMLRARAQRFVRQDLWRKLRGGERFEREERMFAVYGLLSLGWTAMAVLSVLRLLGTSVLRFLQGVLGPGTGLAVMVVLALGLAVLLLLPFVRGLAAARRRPPGEAPGEPG